MIRETLVVRKTLWLALRKQLIGDYGNLDFECEILLLNDPKIHIVACADGDVVNVTITYNPLDIALDIRKTRERGRRGRPLRGKKAINVPLA
ncbi:hypothetical protein [Vulcanisaeta distributa]|uniref:Uncharacterized protein n=1 Tax=Vulcanisaeta distributa (strain DSM 14429 / JCM 11212 / NBRC 100878 / IC-017) TaxID=572478 RepID=E1QNG1_VULDI|nr:hypothetical protein [Vulcanisaeta distributa]ADN50131.1 hypothetical protein Vdis_0738 [Vulcanisaeta distributa DSM 14429]